MHTFLIMPIIYAIVGFLFAIIVITYFIIKRVIEKSSFWELIMAFIISAEIIFMVFPALYEFTGLIAIGWIFGGVSLFALEKLMFFLLKKTLGYKVKRVWLAELCIVSLLCIFVIMINVPAERKRLETLDVDERVYNNLYEETEEMRILIPISGVIAFASGGAFIVSNIKGR